jgi:chemotaxis protein MotB
MIRVPETETFETSTSHTWKMVYADLMTSLTCLFMVLWLINIASVKEKIKLSDRLKREKKQSSEKEPLKIQESCIPIQEPIKKIQNNVVENKNNLINIDDNHQEHFDEKKSIITDASDKISIASEAISPVEPIKPSKPILPMVEDASLNTIPEQHVDEEALQTDNKWLKSVEDVVFKLLKMHKQKDFSPYVQIRQGQYGVEINLVDLDHESLFDLGKSHMFHKKHRILIHIISKALNVLGADIDIVGHTDSLNFKADSHYTNMDLSVTRASWFYRSLRPLLKNHVKIIRVIGNADYEPFVEDNPRDPRNRRISLVINPSKKS